MLLQTSSRSNKLNYVVLFMVFWASGQVIAETNEILKVQQADSKLTVVAPQQKSVKKDLKINLTSDTIVDVTPAAEKDGQNDKLVIIDSKTVKESSIKALEPQTIRKDGNKNATVETATKPISVNNENHQNPAHEDFILNDEDDISESLKTGFYFFLILSSGAILFIVFKIYRLRLSRAERKYGVQGDRSTQELTPLPISIEDGHSDDEDQTIFEIERQNIRIL